MGVHQTFHSYTFLQSNVVDAIANLLNYKNPKTSVLSSHISPRGISQGVRQGYLRITQCQTRINCQTDPVSKYLVYGIRQKSYCNVPALFLPDHVVNDLTIQCRKHPRKGLDYNLMLLPLDSSRFFRFGASLTCRSIFGR